jgi:hypothetical protein
VAKIRNVSGNDLVVPSLGGRLVLAGQIVDVVDDEVYGFTQQAPNWEPADDETQALHDAAAPPVDVEPPALTPDEVRATEGLPPVEVPPEAEPDIAPADVAPAIDTTPEG